MDGRRMRGRAGACLLALTAAAGTGWATTAPAGAAGSTTALAARTCSGTQATPGVLAGTYAGNVTVSGYCIVDGGAAVVDGSLSVRAGATLVAAYAKNDVAGSGTSSLSVTGSIRVARNGVLILGCEGAHFACIDDPGGVLNGSDHVSGSLVAKGALGVVVHATSIGGSVTQAAGGGGVACPFPGPGIFASLPDGTYFSDYEDVSIGGNLKVTGLHSCWIGMLRNTVAGDMTDSGNTFADQDANETLDNTVTRNLTCTGNSPQVQFGDSGGSPNVVYGNATGECAFSLPGGATPVSVKG